MVGTLACQDKLESFIHGWNLASFRGSETAREMLFDIFARRMTSSCLTNQQAENPQKQLDLRVSLMARQGSKFALP